MINELQNMPTSVAAELVELQAALDADIPPKVLDRNLLIGSWNIRAFGNLTKNWHAGEDDKPKRNLHAVREIAEIISRFDVVAIQEVKANIRALRYTLKFLGPDWSFILTDVTKGSPGNGERMAYLFDKRKVQLSGLAAEIVIPKEEMDSKDIKEDALERQFARTPYAVSFKAGRDTFILVTLHVLYGKKAKERVPELKAIGEWLADWAKNINAWDHNLITLGDFNIDRRGDALYDAFTASGLFTPDDLNKVPRTIFYNPNKPPDTDKFYDQIAWFTGKQGTPEITMKYLQAGFFDFTKVALKSLDLTRNELSWRISDHFPLWVEFEAS